MTLNTNYWGCPHRDPNEGPTYMAVFGNFTGGELRVWPKDTKELQAHQLLASQAVDIDVRGQLILFDGTKAHQALP
eukprot:4350358-Prorocentrum_lima.AAC.1